MDRAEFTKQRHRFGFTPISKSESPAPSNTTASTSPSLARGTARIDAFYGLSRPRLSYTERHVRWHLHCDIYASPRPSTHKMHD
jgi:hypothetical protein